MSSSSGGGLAGLTLALQLRARLPALSITVTRARRATRCPKRPTRWASPRSRSALITSTRCSASTRTCASNSCASSASASSSAMAATTSTRSPSSAPAATCTRRATSSIAASSRISCANACAAQGIELLTGATVREMRLADSGTHQRPLPGRRASNTELAADWLVDASGRAGLLRRSSTCKVGQWPPRQRRVVPSRHPRSISTTGRTDAGWHARCDYARTLAVDQPPGRARLLGVADPAVQRLALHRHRGRRGPASAARLTTPSSARSSWLRTHQPKLAA